MLSRVGGSGTFPTVFVTPLGISLIAYGLPDMMDAKSGLICSGGGGGHGNNGGGLTGQIVGSLFGGGKPQNQQSSNQGPGTYDSSSSGGHGQSGLMGLASGFLGGHHGSSV